MSVTLVPEDDLRAALGPYRVDPGTFESAVHATLSDGLSRAGDPFATLSPALRAPRNFCHWKSLPPARCLPLPSGWFRGWEPISF